MSENILLPEMGEGVTEGTVVRWLKREGDAVERDEPILEVETDKVNVELNAETSGVVLKILVDEGETVGVGTVLAVIGEAGEAVDVGKTNVTSTLATMSHQPEHNGESAAAPSQTMKPKTTASRDIGGTRVSPVVARMLQVHEIDVEKLSGSGRDGRITKDDVLAYLGAQEKMEKAQADLTEMLASPTIREQVPRSNTITAALPKPGDELIPLTGMRRSIAEHMVRSKHTSPHAATVFELDFSAVVKHRAAHKAEFERDGVKLTYMPYIIQATVQALKQHPLVNSNWTDAGILTRREINVGMAVAVPNGLIVPVINHADRLNLLGLAQTVNDLSERARNNQLKPDEVKGGTFTISNHGTSGSLIGMPIINQPQAGILGVGMIEKRVKVINDAIAIRPCAYISFSFDHRILDGATADAFIMDIKNAIEGYS